MSNSERRARGPGFPTSSLETARRDAGLSVDELWVRYLGNGGTATPADFRHFLAGHHWPGALQYDIAVSALNDRFTEMNLNHPIPYSDVFAGRAAADWP